MSFSADLSGPVLSCRSGGQDPEYGAEAGEK